MEATARVRYEDADIKVPDQVHMRVEDDLFLVSVVNHEVVDGWLEVTLDVPDAVAKGMIASGRTISGLSF